MASKKSKKPKSSKTPKSMCTFPNGVAVDHVERIERDASGSVCIPFDCASLNNVGHDTSAVSREFLPTRAEEESF